jgi:hypothetical protein
LSPTLIDVSSAPPWNDTPICAPHGEYLALAGSADRRRAGARLRVARLVQPQQVPQQRLPDPDPPMITRISAGFTLKSTPLRMRLRPYQASS